MELIIYFFIMVFLAIIAYPLGMAIADIDMWLHNRKLKREYIKRFGDS